MLPDVPTSAEAGYPTFQATNVTGLIAPAGTPREIIDKVNAATRKVLERPAILERLAQIGAESIADTPEKFGAYIQEDFAMWTRIVKEADVKVD
jgi:tripartite-type tricarboxylate transporter receptor subunit TctC